jgi:hypothetical protein
MSNKLQRDLEILNRTKNLLLSKLRTVGLSEEDTTLSASETLEKIEEQTE